MGMYVCAFLGPLVLNGGPGRAGGWGVAVLCCVDLWPVPSCAMLCCAVVLQLLAVSTSKAVLQLTPTSSFEDYLGAEYAADAVSETLIDPLTPSGFDMMSSSKKDKSSKSGSAYGGSDAGGVLGAEDYDGMVWGEAPESDGSKGSSSSSSKKWARKAGSGGSSKGGKEGAGAAAEGVGRVLRARCWMAQDFPMSLAQLLPLLDVIGNANKHMAKVW